MKSLGLKHSYTQLNHKRKVSNSSALAEKCFFESPMASLKKTWSFQIQVEVLLNIKFVLLKIAENYVQMILIVFHPALLALSSSILFAIEIDNINRSFVVTRGISFYLQVRFIFAFNS